MLPVLVGVGNMHEEERLRHIAGLDRFPGLPIDDVNQYLEGGGKGEPKIVYGNSL